MDPFKRDKKVPKGPKVAVLIIEIYFDRFNAMNPLVLM